MCPKIIDGDEADNVSVLISLGVRAVTQPVAEASTMQRTLTSKAGNCLLTHNSLLDCLKTSCKISITQENWAILDRGLGTLKASVCNCSLDLSV